MPPVVRPATHADLPAITEIYNEAGVGTTASYDLEPVTVAQRRAWFDSLVERGCGVFVLDDGHVMGYAAYGPFRDKAGYAHTVEHSVYLRPECRGSGGGRALMEALLAHAKSRGMHVMVGVLDAGNDASLAFHRCLGFTETAVLPQVGRKFDRWLDFVFVTRRLD